MTLSETLNQAESALSSCMNKLSPLLLPKPVELGLGPSVRKGLKPLPWVSRTPRAGVSGG